MLFDSTVTSLYFMPFLYLVTVKKKTTDPNAGQETTNKSKPLLWLKQRSKDMRGLDGRAYSSCQKVKEIKTGIQHSGTKYKTSKIRTTSLKHKNLKEKNIKPQDRIFGPGHTFHYF